MTPQQKAKTSALNGLTPTAKTLLFSTEEIAFINRMYRVYETSDNPITQEEDQEIDRLHALAYDATPGIPQRLDALESRLASVEALVSRG